MALFHSLLISIILLLISPIRSADNGWGANIDWQPSMEQFYKQMSQSGKPGMLIIHKSWCGACKNLRPKFAASTEIEKLSEEFVMINTLDDEEPEGSEFQPDGGYIPRILFFDPKTRSPDSSITNYGRKDYRYFYSSAAEIVKSMDKVLKQDRPLFTDEKNDMRTDEEKRAAERANEF